MTPFADIEALARDRHPDLDDRLAAHDPPRSAQELADIPDDRWLSMMTRCVFQAGFVWKVIEAKWPGFEEAFDGFDRFLAHWPTDDQPGLLAVLKQRGSRLSGMTAQYFLRFSGWDAWIMSGDVGKALVREGVVDKAPTSKSALAKVQAAIAAWAQDSGRSQSEVSRILALSVG